MVAAMKVTLLVYVRVLLFEKFDINFVFAANRCYSNSGIIKLKNDQPLLTECGVRGNSRCGLVAIYTVLLCTLSEDSASE
jgi:hypothetical protein